MRKLRLEKRKWYNQHPIPHQCITDTFLFFCAVDAVGQLSPCCLVNTASPKASQFLGVANFTCGRAHLSNTNPSIQSPHTEHLSSLPHTTPSPGPEQLGTFLGLTACWNYWNYPTWNLFAFHTLPHSSFLTKTTTKHFCPELSSPSNLPSNLLLPGVALHGNLCVPPVFWKLWVKTSRQSLPCLQVWLYSCWQ